MSVHKQFRLKNNMFSSLVPGIVLLSCFPAFAHAQQETSESAELEKHADASDIEQVVITGSRLRQDGSLAPTPVTVLSSDEIEAGGKTNIADFINDLPQLQNSSTPRSIGFTSSSGLQGANLLNLRNLGTNRTLVLLDGRRVVPGVPTGSVDLSLLPSALVKRVDIVTGGASAAYGADAVAGVVNLVLDTKYTGVKAHIQGGSSSEGDAESKSGSIAGGTSFANGRGHVVGTIEYAENKAAFASERDWAKSKSIIPNPNYSQGGAEHERIIVDSGLGLATPGGLIINTPLRGTQFDDNGNPVPFDFGAPTGNGFIAVSSDAYNPIALQQLIAPLERFSGFMHATYDLTDSTTIYGEASYGKSTVRQETLPLFRFANQVVQNDNPYLDAVTSQRLSDAGESAFVLGKLGVNLGVAEPVGKREIQRYLVGIDGELSNDWSWSAYYQYGDVDINARAQNNPIVSRFILAADAVADEAGNVVCRSALDEPSNGCLPYNVFGNQPVADDVKAYLTGTAVSNQKLKQHVWSASMTGVVADLWAGPLTAAFGADYRKESGSGDADEQSINNEFFVGNFKPFSGKVNVKEGYLELGLPVLDDVDYGTIDINSAIRWTDYSNSGSVRTWKAGVIYSPINELRFRVTRSSDIRAPNINDLFSGGRVRASAVNDPFRDGESTQYLERSAGNPDLRPEEADTLTVGGSYAPDWLPGFSMSVDYFDIDINDAIGDISSQNILDNCFEGQTDYCAYVARNGDGLVTQISKLPFNFQAEQMTGVDMEFAYTMDLGKGELKMRAFATHVSKLSIGVPGTLNFVSRKGEVGNNAGAADSGAPDWRGIGNIGYEMDSGTNIGATLRFIGEAKVESDFASNYLQGNDVPSRTYLDLNISQEFNLSSGTLKVFAVVDNVFDRDPPVVVSLQGTSPLDLPTNGALYDTIGRTIRIGTRIEF
jgi:outer membrane receptor protein involved in Fe transport